MNCDCRFNKRANFEWYKVIIPEKVSRNIEGKEGEFKDRFRGSSFGK